MKLIPFITAGYPSLEGFLPTLRELDANGADVIEVGIPFSDPVADGPVIEAASIVARQNGASLRRILDLLEELGRTQAKLVLMGYMNPFLQYGFEALAERCKRLGIYGLIIPDLPLDEDAPYREILARAGIHLIALVAPNTPVERMRQYAKVATGYVYVVSSMGVTGVRKEMPPDLAETMRRARSVFSLPLALGFGLSTPEQLKGIPSDCLPDAVIFGSALVKHLGEGGSAAAFMQRWASVK